MGVKWCEPFTGQNHSWCWCCHKTLWALCFEMALVPHASSSSQDENRGAIVAIRGAEELTQEEYEKRIKDVRNTHRHIKLRS